MKFDYQVSDKQTELICQIESEEELIGYRDQTPYNLIKWPLDQTEVRIKFNRVIDLKKKEVHPDLLALAYLTLVYPFLKESVTFPKPVSTGFAQALKTFPLKAVVNRVYQPVGFLKEVGPIDDDLKGWSEWLDDEQMESMDGSGKIWETGLAFGGGLDSSAIKALYPEAWLIHDLMGKENETSRQWGPYGKKLGHNRFIGVQTSTRSVHRGVGWASWVSCLTLSVLLASELKLGRLLYGTNMADFFRVAGGAGQTKYRRTFQIPNRSPWVDLFFATGIRLYSPVLGVSALGCAQLTMAGGLLQRACWCYQGNNKKACHHCPKCFRKEVLLTGLGVGPLMPITRDRTAVRKEGQRWPPAWRRYPDYRVVKMLNTFDYGPSIHRAFLLMAEKDNWHPKMSKNRQLTRILSDQSRTHNILSWLPTGLEYLPAAVSDQFILCEDDRLDLVARLTSQGCQPMTDEQLKFLNDWSLPSN